MKSFYGIFCCFILLLSSGLLVAAGPNDAVSIPDAHLRGVINVKLGRNKNSTADITEADMASVTGSLSINSENVANLTGIQYATGITELYLNNTAATDFSPLSGLTQLLQLTLNETSITDLTPLKPLTKLTHLELDGVYRGTPTITDIEPLKHLTKLESLYLRSQSITNISHLSGLTKLIHLFINWNPGISSISAVSGMTELRTLDLSECPITDLRPLANLTKLSDLRLGFNRNLTDTAFKNADLSKLTALKRLNITATNLSDLSVLGGLPNSVQLDRLFISDLGPTSDSSVRVLKDLKPLVDLMNASKIIKNGTVLSAVGNWNFDYESIYTHLPALLAGGVQGLYGTRPIYSSPFAPGIAAYSERNYTGFPGESHTFSVQAHNVTTHRSSTYRNDTFAKVPVKWKLTAPDGTVTESTIKTGDSGRSFFTFTLGSHGQAHTVEATVPAKTNSQSDLSHAQLGPHLPQEPIKRWLLLR